MVVMLAVSLYGGAHGASEDLRGKMFTFPQESDTAYVRLRTTTEEMKATTVCLSFFTELSDREQYMFSLASRAVFNDFRLGLDHPENKIVVFARNQRVVFSGLDYKLNEWNHLCATWDSGSGLAQAWLNGKPSARKHTSAGSAIIGNFFIVLGQEQDSYGGGFDSKQSFEGMISDVHVWDSVLTPCELQYYVGYTSRSPGNVLQWGQLDFSVHGRVLKEDQQICS